MNPAAFTFCGIMRGSRPPRLMRGREAEPRSKRVQAVFESTGLCRIVDSDGREQTRFPTVYRYAFNSQYPPPLSPDRQALYVGTWEAGLYCYDTATGALRWRQEPGKVRGIFPVDDGVVAELCGRGLFMRDQGSGALQRKVAMGGIEVASRLASDRLFAGPLRQAYLIFALPQLSPVEFVRAADVNVNACRSLVIREVRQNGPEIVVSGFEAYPGGDDASSSLREFERRVRARPA